ncbi:hypothetical protein RCL1_004249 [Eukaryota sp. TZLM3-RCL]
MSDEEPTQTPPDFEQDHDDHDQEQQQQQQEESGDVVPEDDEEEYIRLKVRGQDMKETVFRIKRNTPLRKLMDTFCRRAGHNDQSLRFLVDGERIQPQQTAIDLGLENDQIVEAVYYQIGGGSL